MIPFNKPTLTDLEFEYMADAVQRGKISGNGYYTKKCQQLFESQFGFNKVLLTSSCTDALEMAALLLNIQPGDEVIMPAYAYVSTANAFVLRGAKIVFVDVEQDFPNIDADSIAPLITSKTKAIVLIHYAGAACNMGAILELAVDHNLFIVEDAAAAIGSYYGKIPVGSIGHLAAFSFHETKNIQCGEGGMLVINDERFIERAEIIWEKGTNRAAFARGETDSYNWLDIGSSFLPSDLTAAFLYAQAQQLTNINALRKVLWHAYYERLAPYAGRNSFQLLDYPEYANHNHHTFAIVCRSEKERNALITIFGMAGILAVSHYRNLAESPFFEAQKTAQKFFNSSRFEACLLRLPLYQSLKFEQIDTICDKIKAFYY
jgi:dTDP-4-amino-4,6-dideoxygalactose transaminase